MSSCLANSCPTRATDRRVGNLASGAPDSRLGKRKVRRRELSTEALRTALVCNHSEQLRAGLLLLLLAQLQLRQISGQRLYVRLGQLASDADHD